MYGKYVTLLGTQNLHQDSLHSMDRSTYSVIIPRTLSKKEMATQLWVNWDFLELAMYCHPRRWHPTTSEVVFCSQKDSSNCRKYCHLLTVLLKCNSLSTGNRSLTLALCLDYHILTQFPHPVHTNTECQPSTSSQLFLVNIETEWRHCAWYHMAN